MKTGLVVVVALLVSALGAHFLLEDPGYVVINFRNYVVEMSVPVLVGLFLALVVAGWLVGELEDLFVKRLSRGGHRCSCL